MGFVRRYVPQLAMLRITPRWERMIWPVERTSLDLRGEEVSLGRVGGVGADGGHWEGESRRSGVLFHVGHPSRTDLRG